MSHAPQHGRKFSRKDVLRAGGLAGLLAVGLPGCDLLSTNPGRRDSGKAAAKGREAPALAGKVKKGSLPPVKNRLPDKPVVVDAVERTGVYGGDWTTVLQGSADTAWPNRILFYDYLLRWDPDWKRMVPNLAERFEANTDGTAYTFTIRRGIKWSDGEPFTVDDIVFAQNDVLNNTELWPVAPWPAHAEKVDDLTVRLTLDKPDGLFLQRQATALGMYLVQHPKHYAMKFHPTYNKDVNALAKKAELQSWVDLYAAKTDPYSNPELPVLFAWKFTRPTGTGTRAVAERN
ncbi:MAG TPA: ABC transporter substrate-binding protein, partial [Actinopolymorphaceae bacterium]|nr:ABC transporter substrate-binding protein [Actinopolymorphaceae bacterium]